MDIGITGRERRPLRVHTLHGVIEGDLWTSARLRTLDDLNLQPKRFLKLERVDLSSVGWTFGDGPVNINLETILFICEQDGSWAGTKNRRGGARLVRALVRLRVAAYDVQGFLHVPEGGSPLPRLSQETNRFLALTSASVVGPDLEFTAPFLAVNRKHILAIQEMLSEESEKPGLDPQRAAV